MEWVELGARVEVGAWKHVLDIRDSCHIQLERRRRRFDERWGKIISGESMEMNMPKP